MNILNELNLGTGFIQSLNLKNTKHIRRVFHFEKLLNFSFI